MTESFGRSTAYLLAIISGAGLVLSCLLLLMVKLFTTAILEITLFLSVLTTVAYAVYLYIQKSYAAAVIMTIVSSHSLSRYLAE